MTDLPQGYEPHEIPADYTGPLFIEGQMRAFAESETARLREAARMALGLIVEAEDTPVWSDYADKVRQARDALREALGETDA